MFPGYTPREDGDGYLVFAAFYIYPNIRFFRGIKGGFGYISRRMIASKTYFLPKKLKVCNSNHINKKRPFVLNERPFVLWEYTGSNRGPSACKADALNQLSYTPNIFISMYFSNCGPWRLWRHALPAEHFNEKTGS